MQLFRLYQETINFLKQKFTRGELCMMIDILNGTYLDLHILPCAIIASVEDSFELYPGMYEDEWDVKREEIVEKLKTLGEFHLSCLAIWANDFWYGSQHPTDAGLDLDKYLKEAPAITHQLESAAAHIKVAIDLMEKTKGAFRSAQIAAANKSAQKAKEILEKLI